MMCLSIGKKWGIKFRGVNNEKWLWQPGVDLDPFWSLMWLLTIDYLCFKKKKTIWPNILRDLFYFIQKNKNGMYTKQSNIISNCLSCSRVIPTDRTNTIRAQQERRAKLEPSLHEILCNQLKWQLWKYKRFKNYNRKETPNYVSTIITTICKLCFSVAGDGWEEKANSYLYTSCIIFQLFHMSSNMCLGNHCAESGYNFMMTQ